MLLFGAFELDVASFQLRREGEAINLEPQVLSVIMYLAEHRERMVTKEELLDEIWGDRFVSESALTSRIKSARRALGDDGRTQSMIRTVHGRGYQFLPFVTDSEALPGRPDGSTAALQAGTVDPDAALAAARQAVADARWRAARTEYASIGVEGLDGDDLERWGDAAWWDTEIVECISVRQQAFRRYCTDGDSCSAARVAIALADDYVHRGSSTVAMTWLDRADELLADSPNCREMGQLLRLRSAYQLELQGDPAGALSTNEQLRDVADSLADADLVAQSLQDHGRILVAMGSVEDGMAMIDQSMLIAATTPTTANVRGRLYCNMLSACVGLGHFKRALDWSDEALAWCAAQGQSPFPGVCEVHRAGLRRRGGDFDQALADLERIAADSQLSNIVGPAWLEIGQIQLARGDVDAAQAAFLQADAHGTDAVAGFALVAIEQDRVSDAIGLLQDALSARGDDCGVRRQLLPYLVDAAAIEGEIDIARHAAIELSRLTADGSEAARACSARAEATAAMVEGHFEQAVESLRISASLYRDASHPLELATARLGLAVASLALGSVATARLERDAALAIYRGVGVEPRGIARRWSADVVDIH